MIDKSLKQKLLQLNPLAIFYYFCATIVVVRGVIFLSLFWNHTPAIFVRGWHIHHFIFGFLFLLLALDETGKAKFPRFLLEIFYGIGFGLIFDEFAYWTFGRFDYWSIHNFYAMVALSIAAGILTAIDQQTYHFNVHRKKTRPAKFSFKRHFCIPCLSFMGLLSIFFLIR
ncbi:MAG TPA: hypothetical protein VFX17_00145 [Patescibacteria group bacterium]|nr:hypothetical protein [Patescibacteria group bacterium]